MPSAASRQVLWLVEDLSHTCKVFPPQSRSSCCKSQQEGELEEDGCWRKEILQLKLISTRAVSLFELLLSLTSGVVHGL